MIWVPDRSRRPSSPMSLAPRTQQTGNGAETRRVDLVTDQVNMTRI